MWETRRHEVVDVPRHEKGLYTRRSPRSVYGKFQPPTRKGIHHAGEFPVAVVRKLYADRGYDCWVSGASTQGCRCYLLERMPGKRQAKDLAYLKMIDVFGEPLLKELHSLASAERRLHALRTPGGDPDLFVQSRTDTTDRFFVEVKLEDLTGRKKYRDTLKHQQVVLFPLIEKKLGCDVRLVTVRLVRGRKTVGAD